MDNPTYNLFRLYFNIILKHSLILKIIECVLVDFGISILVDKNDSRALRLYLTEKCIAYFNGRGEKNSKKMERNNEEE